MALPVNTNPPYAGYLKVNACRVNELCESLAGFLAPDVKRGLVSLLAQRIESQKLGWKHDLFPGKTHSQCGPPGISPRQCRKLPALDSSRGR